MTCTFPTGGRPPRSRRPETAGAENARLGLIRRQISFFKVVTGLQIVHQRIAMLLTSAGGASFTVSLPNEQATGRASRSISPAALEAGDLVTLSGDLGAGKTTFARALIRYLAGDDTDRGAEPDLHLPANLRSAAVPARSRRSLPALGRGRIAELGFDDLPEEAVVLMEWADRAAGFLPPDRLDITFTLEPQLGAEVRNARYTGYGAFAAARRAHRAGARLPRRVRLRRRRSAGACRATPRRAFSSG